MPVVGAWVTAWMEVVGEWATIWMPVVGAWVTAWMPVCVVGARVTARRPVYTWVTAWNLITIQSPLLGDKGLDQWLSQRQQIPIPLPIGLPLTSFIVVDLCVMLVRKHLNPKVSFLLMFDCIISSISSANLISSPPV